MALLEHVATHEGLSIRQLAGDIQRDRLPTPDLNGN